MSLATARAAIADTLRRIDGLEVYEFPEQSANLPMAHVLLDSIDPDFVLDNDRGRYQFVVRLFVGRSDQAETIGLMDPFLAPSGYDSVRGVLNEDPTLDDAIDSVRVTEVRNQTSYDVGGQPLLGVEFVLDVVG